MPLTRIQYPSPGFSQHWKEPAGRNMLKKIGTIPSEADIHAFNTLYLKCDTQADQVVNDLFAGMGHKQGHALLDALLEEGLQAVPEIPASLRELYTNACILPSWVDAALLQKGAEYCQRTGLYALITLRNYSLMGGYESAAINKPLIFTGALKAGPAKRLAETVAFWVDVTGDHALKPGAVGFNAAIRVRIIHALARYYTRKSPDWSDDQWGIPVNEGDMVATYLGFSLVFLEGLYMLGYRPSEEEMKGVFHLWKYIGHLIGIDYTLLPETEEEAIQSLYKWTMTQPPADADTIALAHALKDAPLTATFPEKLWQKKILVKIYLGFNYFYLGNHACKRMFLPWTTYIAVPYILTGINLVKEYWIRIFPEKRKYAISKGRRDQVKITEAFLQSTGFGKLIHK
ncbi:MAG: oxygenase MpaB family protein [Cytophaga sp.]|uniref:oxygenase MpaB family protein n=1 Tax=Cytophaga sp. TaxID=29535 RepID=UPI003F7E2A62